MTEKQFFDYLEKQLAGHLEESALYKEKFVKRLLALLQEKAGDLRSAEGQKRLKLLRRIFVAAGYGQYWRLVQESFERLLAAQNEHWRKNTKAGAATPRSNTRLLGFEAVEFEQFGKLGKDSIEELNRLFSEAQKDNWTRARLIEEIGAMGGKTGQYSEAIADTALRGWDRTVTAIKAEAAGIEKALYDGPALIPTSHKFCEEHYKRIYSRDEILEMDNGQLNPVITYCGGYRCRHRWRWLIRKVLK